MRIQDLQIGETNSPSGSLDMEPTPEARRQMRYPLRAPVAFEWIGRDGMRHEAKGHSRDLSEGGVYVLARACPSIGAAIRLVIRFSHPQESTGAQRIVMDGRVVRVELLLAGKANWGFAVESSQSVLHEDGDSNSDE
jgi:hypothetical protein